MDCEVRYGFVVEDQPIASQVAVYSKAISLPSLPRNFSDIEVDELVFAVVGIEEFHGLIVIELIDRGGLVVTPAHAGAIKLHLERKGWSFFGSSLDDQAVRSYWAHAKKTM